MLTVAVVETIVTICCSCCVTMFDSLLSDLALPCCCFVFDSTASFISMEGGEFEIRVEASC